MSPLRRDAIKMTPEEVDCFLRSHWWMIVGTQGRLGFPHLVTMGYAVLDHTVAFTTFAKSQKILNLRRDPHVTCLIEENQDRYDQIRGVQFTGLAEIVTDAELDRLVTRTCLEQKLTSYGPGSEPTSTDLLSLESAAALQPKRVVVTIRPEQVVSWDHSRLGGIY